VNAGTAPSDPAAARLPAGTLVGGRFVVEGVLGEGGMGAVYAARDKVIDRKVALKVLHLGRAQDSERFRLEAAAASRISSRHVSAIHDYGRDEGLDCEYLVMELLDGAPLDAVLAERDRLSYEQAAAIGADIAEALGAAHAADVVHRDLKPGNIWLLAEGGAKVIDFGIARVSAPERAREGDALTNPDMIMGTPRYISPEAVEGVEVGPMADLYALGVVLFEMVAGEPPFADAVPSVLCAMHLRTPPPTISDLRPDIPVPEAYQDLVSALLEKDPRRRPQAAEEVSQILRAMAAETGPIRLVGERHSLGAKTATVMRGGAPGGSPLAARLPLLVAIGIALIAIMLLGLVLVLVSKEPEGIVAVEQDASRVGEVAPTPEGSTLADGEPQAGPNAMHAQPTEDQAEAPPSGPEGMGAEPTNPESAEPGITPPAEGAAVVEVSVVVVPGHATLTLDSEPVTSPVSLPDDASEHVLEASAPGYRSARRIVRGDRDRGVSITLRRRARRPGLPAKLRQW